MQNILCPDIFYKKRSSGSYVMRENVRKKIVESLKFFVDFLNINDTQIIGVYLVGSMANYNWNENSDVDIHLRVNFNSLSLDSDLVRDFFNTKKTLFNCRYNIMIKDHPIEFYVEDVNDNVNSSGVYDLLDNDWITIPQKDDIPSIDKPSIKKKYKEYIRLLEFVKENENVITLKYLENLKSKIYSLRKEGLQNNGEYSTGNIVFKLLRRKGYIEYIKQLMISNIEKELSLESVLEDITSNSRNATKMSQRDPGGFENTGRKSLNLIPKYQRNKNIYYNKSNQRQNSDTHGITKIPEIERLRNTNQITSSPINTITAQKIAKIYNIDYNELLNGAIKGVGTTGIKIQHRDGNFILFR